MNFHLNQNRNGSLHVCPNCGSSELVITVNLGVSQNPDGTWELIDDDIVGQINAALNNPNTIVECCNRTCVNSFVTDANGNEFDPGRVPPLKYWGILNGVAAEDEEHLTLEQFNEFKAWEAGLKYDQWSGYLSDTEVR